MPTAPDPNSPYIATRLKSMFGVNAPGQAGAGRPTAVAGQAPRVNPPGVAQAPIGRPPGMLTTPTPQGMTQQPPPPSGQPAQPQTIIPPANQQDQQAAPAAQAPQPAQAPAQAQPQQPEPDAHAIAQTRQRLGPLPKLFRHPSLPELPVQPGALNYNPLTGMWSR